jgi:hypothetical protein
MTSKEAILTEILNFTDDEFFDIDPSILSSREWSLLDMDFFGLAIAAPGEIMVDEKDKIPLIMAVHLSGERDWEFPMSDNCILVGTDLQDGSVHFAKAFVDRKERKNRGIKKKVPRGPKPSGLVSAAAKLIELDPKDHLSIPWSPGIWAVGVIYYDWSSNSVTVELMGEEEIPSSPAHEIYPEPDPKGTGLLPSFVPGPQIPAPPDSGLVFTGKIKVEDGQQHLNIFGSFALMTRYFHLPERKIVHQFQDGKQHSVAAVIPVTFAILGMNWDTPIQIDWAFPVYGEPLEVSTKAQGYFAIDALENRPPLAPGQYICYLIMDGHIYGPKIFKIN